MSEQILLQLAGVLILGIAMQWFAWRLRLPAILMLLGAGLLLGPGSQVLVRFGVLHEPWLEPDKLFGNLLLPAVSLAVALILFEGGLTLNLREHKASSGVIWSLVTLGAAATFCVAALAAFALLGLNWRLSVLLGAILVVTGPTVIGPLLRHVRPSGKVGSILKWEGIIIDPIGAMMAIVVFEALISRQLAALPMLRLVSTIVLVGSACGAAAAGVIVLLFKRHWVPDFLHNSFVLVMVLLAFAGSNFLQPESGLFATTLMGLVLANQRRVNVNHVMEFKESVTILLISALFIVLGARLTLHQLASVPWGGMMLFLLALILIARPLTVLISTLFSSLTWPERKFLAVLAPRGIVAAAVASVFALRLDHEHFEQADMLVPITFATIIGTVTFYGLTAATFARKLGLAHVGSHGFLIAGAGKVERTLAAALQAEGQPLLMVDTNRENIAAARMQGVQVLLGSVLSRFVMDETQLMPVGRFLALTSNDEVNALATMRYQRLFSRSEVYQLAPIPRTSARQETVAGDLQGRVLFGATITYGTLEHQLDAGHLIKKTLLTADFPYEAFLQTNDPDVVPLFVRTALGELQLFTAEFPPKPKPGDAIYTLAPPKRQNTTT
jgi:NhaP-type Na+/H+ or K+/H+ antiporter